MAGRLPSTMGTQNRENCRMKSKSSVSHFLILVPLWEALGIWSLDPAIYSYIVVTICGFFAYNKMS
jgi:hypothetical protein